jgi:hypothetical protein
MNQLYKPRRKNIVEKNEIFAQKFGLLKLEINILNDRINHVISNLWQIRQISLTLWLAALGVGFGALSQGNKPFPNILILSAFVPLLFLLIDARMTRWYFVFMMRDSEIQRFLGEQSYVLPSTLTPMSFDQSLEEQILNFPVYDLTGDRTFGNDKYFRWNTKVRRSFIAATPLVFYGLQILASVLFASLEFHNSSNFKLLLILILRIFAIIERKRLTQ